MRLDVTEHKSVGVLGLASNNVRVFVDGDFHYGYFVPERALFSLLTEDQRIAYLEGSSARIDVSPETAQKVIDMGASPYKKPRVI